MELGLGVWMDKGSVQSDRMKAELWPSRGYYRDLNRYSSYNVRFMYLVVL